MESKLNINLPYAILDIENNGGSVPSGAYSVVFRYRTDINNKSTFGIPSRMIYITDDVGQDNTVDGCPPGTQTTKSIKITPTNIDSNYPYIEPIIITYVGITNVLTIKSLGIYPNDGANIYFRDEAQYQDSVSIEEILENPIFYSSAECIEQKDNILVISNLQGKTYDRGFQEVANDIEVTWYIDNSIKKNSSENLDIDFSFPGPPEPDNLGYIKRYDNYTPTISSGYLDAKFPYKNGLDKKGFTRGEVYSFSITPIYKDGSIGFAYHIPAKTHTINSLGEPTTDIYQSEEPYPDYLREDPDFTSQFGENIRHHKMPDYNSSGTMQCSGVNTGILKIKLNNIKFTQEQKSLIQGYIVGYQPRNSDSNTRIVDSGWGKPYMSNGNFYLNSFFNGSCRFEFNNGADMSSDLFDKGIMYYSPDTFIGKELNTSYKVQIYGWAKEKFAYTPSPGIGTYIPIFHTTFPDNAYSTTGLYFEHFTTTIDCSPLVNINTAVKVPATGTPTTVLNKYRLEFSDFYYHLDLNEDILLSVDWPTHYLQTSGVTYIARKQSTGDNFLGLKSNTFASIPLMRIVNDITFQYGKLENAEYIPSEVVFNLEQTSIAELEGDTFVSKYFHHNTDGTQNGFNGTGFDSNTNRADMFHFYAGIWYESKNNYAFRHYDAVANEVPYYPKYRLLHSETSTEKGLIDYEWFKRGFGYNRQYSASNNFKPQVSKPLFFEEVTSYTNRSIYSKQSFENELADQYRYFPNLQYHDVPKHRGTITDTFVFNNNFYHHTEYGLWLSYFNPNTTQATSQGQVVLGNAGVFQLPSKLVLDIKGGYMGTLDKSGTNTPFGRVFLDHKQGKVFLFAGEAPVEISDLGLFSFFREFVNTNDKYSMGYDWANKRLLLNNITKEKAISFYPKTQTWTSFHDFSPVVYFTTNGSSYAFNSSNFYNLDNPDGIRKNSYITFVSNTLPDNFKRFDRMELNTMSGGNQGINSPGFVEPDNYIFNDKSFSKIHCWTDRQNSTELPLVYSDNYEDNFLNGYDVDKVPVNYYRSSFHLELPLDAVVNPYKSIFDNTNLNINADFRAHMKGKFLYTKLSYNEDKPLVLNYIKTFFKPSVA